MKILDQNIAFNAKHSFFNLKGSYENQVCVMFQCGNSDFIYHVDIENERHLHGLASLKS